MAGRRHLFPPIAWSRNMQMVLSRVGATTNANDWIDGRVNDSDPARVTTIMGWLSDKLIDGR